MADDRLSLPSGWRERLAALRAEPKFAPADGYMGYLPEEHRPAAAKLITDLIDRLASGLEDNPSRAWLGAQIKDTYDWFRLSDTEDRDRCAFHIAEILGAIGIEVAGWEAMDEWVDRFDLEAAFVHPQLEG